MKGGFAKSKFLEILGENPWISFAAKKSGISRATIYRWMKDIPEFREAVNKAIQSGDTQNLEIAQMQLHKKIKDGYFPAIKYFLDHNDPRYIIKQSIYESEILIHNHSNGPEVCEACIRATAEKEARKKEVANMIRDELERLVSPKTEKDKEDTGKLFRVVENNKNN